MIGENNIRQSTDEEVIEGNQGIKSGEKTALFPTATLHNDSIIQSSMEEEPFFTGKRSRMSATLLSNYILSISLLKNIARHFTDQQKFQDEF